MTGKRFITVSNLSAAIAIIWGIFVANPWVDSFAKNPKIYAPMAWFCSYEILWGAGFALSGITALIFIRRGRPDWASLLLGNVFCAMASLFFLGDSGSQGWGVYGVIALANIIQWEARTWKTSSNG